MGRHGELGLLVFGMDERMQAHAKADWSSSMFWKLAIHPHAYPRAFSVRYAEHIVPCMG
jgi:hypothetical protein